jgi:hypothetical protein
MDPSQRAATVQPASASLSSAESRSLPLASPLLDPEPPRLASEPLSCIEPESVPSLAPELPPPADPELLTRVASLPLLVPELLPEPDAVSEGEEVVSPGPASLAPSPPLGPRQLATRGSAAIVARIAAASGLMVAPPLRGISFGIGVAVKARR